MKLFAIVLPISFVAWAVLFPSNADAQSTAPPAKDGLWSKQLLTDDFWAEGAAAADVNKDGKVDVFYGPYWFEGPDFKKRHVIYPDTKRSSFTGPNGEKIEIPGFKGGKTNTNEYSDNFISGTHDVNGDGWPDYIVAGFPGKETFWYENPQGGDQPWKRHVVWHNTDNESPLLAIPPWTWWAL